MKRISLIILSILLIHTSPVSAGVGDVYYCTPKKHIGIENFKLRKYVLQRFTFKRTAKGLIFGKGGSFSDFKMQRKIFDTGTERFQWASPITSILSYDGGQFTFVQGTTVIAAAMQGTCSVF